MLDLCRQSGVPVTIEDRRRCLPAVDFQFQGDLKPFQRTAVDAMPARLHINYAIKANSHPDVLGFMTDLVDGYDIASGGELEKIVAAGATKAIVVEPGTLERLRLYIREHLAVFLAR